MKIQDKLSGSLLFFFLIAIFLPFLCADWRIFLQGVMHLRKKDRLAQQFHFGFRDGLAQLYGNIWNRFLHVRRFHNVVTGKQGWYFYGDPVSLDSYRRTTPFTDVTLEKLINKLQARQDWLEKQGIHFLFVVAPDKHTIYPEFMPDDLSRINRPSHLDAFMAYAAAHSHLHVLDLRPALQKARITEQTYYRTDTHWNSAGAYCGYVAIMKRLNDWFPAAHALPRSELRNRSSMRKGDLYQMLSLGDKPEPEEQLVPVAGWHWRAITDEAIISSVDERPLAAQPVPATSCTAGEIKRVVIFHDSFVQANLHPFLAEHCGRMIPVWTYSFDADLVQREKPDLVIQETVERYIYPGN